MTIYVTREEGGGLKVVSGHMRLQTMLSVNGKASVQNMQTGEQLEVHEVGGRLLALTEDAAATVESAAAALISNAAKR